MKTKARAIRIGENGQRLSSPVTMREDMTILAVDNYPPFLLNVVSNAWQRMTAAIYRTRFDLGIVEWRVISMLAIEPRITANRICEVLRLDKSAVSRALGQLLAKGHVHFEAQPSDPRKRRWWLSMSGRRAHDELLTIALDCEARLIRGVSPDDLEAFLRVTRRMLANMEADIEAPGDGGADETE
ncbi:MarR family winged helix-turn-helix transcriptional regulator [Amaricoccus solimangrovi]|uniref:Winged helix-turn-helix transcriptional regulator n=1 Tax=Amaricoccus solimangrovi TaxID=2589815 RepID=A0A501WS67_9RHOB|nr:MarR family winged helix-turn-helix transcriptional regulator [Amaricoccus solimangrovi]TPE51682.1 winged helix-turn-helix transcriptional regulator [Amaricoccus solimangrovi]